MGGHFVCIRKRNEPASHCRAAFDFWELRPPVSGTRPFKVEAGYLASAERIGSSQQSADDLRALVGKVIVIFLRRAPSRQRVGPVDFNPIMSAQPTIRAKL